VWEKISRKSSGGKRRSSECADEGVVAVPMLKRVSWNGSLAYRLEGRKEGGRDRSASAQERKWEVTLFS
jgi:hypothetical protein